MLSLEIKARLKNPAKVREILLKNSAVSKGTDYQNDTYFDSPFGRLKLREGKIETALIFYKRENKKKSKQCESVLYKTQAARGLKKVLESALKKTAVVRKRREIYFIGAAKFHIDKVEKLGSFVEIEVFERKGKRDAASLKKESLYYQNLLGISSADLLSDSYSDQLLKVKNKI